MRYVVDGYNYAHRAGLMTAELESVRRKLGTRLKALAGGGDRVTVVWDSARAPEGRPRRTESGGVEHLFARVPGSADREIAELVRQADDPGGLCVVSDDSEVARSARQLGAWSMSVQEAEARIASRESARRRHRLDDPEDGGKPRPPTGRELDEWEKLFDEGG